MSGTLLRHPVTCLAPVGLLATAVVAGAATGPDAAASVVHTAEVWLGIAVAIALGSSAGSRYGAVLVVLAAEAAALGTIAAAALALDGLPARGAGTRALGLFLEMAVIGGIATVCATRHRGVAAAVATACAILGQDVHAATTALSGLGRIGSAAVAPIPDLVLFDAATLVRGGRVDPGIVIAACAYGASWIAALAVGAALAAPPASTSDSLPPREESV